MSYAAMALQLTAQSVEQCPDRDSVQQQVLAMVADIDTKIAGAVAFTRQFAGSPVRLIVLPEYLFTSFPGRISVADFADKVAWDMEGKEYDAIAALAQRHSLFLAANAYERDPHFPGLYFQTCVIFGPSGNLVLRYRRLNSMFAPTPHDVWKAYLDIYGLDGVFPVARTEIGNLAAIASEEILYPEIARAHALRGAEVFVHSSSEKGGPAPTHKSLAKRSRAIENLAYVVSANTAGIAGTALPLACADGNSMVVDWQGQILSESGSGETFTATADINIEGLRRARHKPGMCNYLSRQRTELFAAAYSATSVHPANSLLGKQPEREHFTQIQADVLERMDREGIL